MKPCLLLWGAAEDRRKTFQAKLWAQLPLQTTNVPWYRPAQLSSDTGVETVYFGMDSELEIFRTEFLER